MPNRQWSIDAVWDIECAQWDQFLCGALWTARDGMRVYRREEDLADALMSLPKGTQTWAHAGGKYDVLWLLEHLAKRGSMPDAQVTTSGASATSVKFKGGPWLRDSARLVPMSLATAATIAGPNRSKGDPGIDFEDMHKGMTPQQWAKVIRYMVGDVELLRDVLLAIGDYADANEIELRGTIGGTGWATAAAWCELEKAEWSTDLYKLADAMYYGGRCEVARTVAEVIHRYDRKSAYMASLELPIPEGQPTFCDSVQASAAFARGQPGGYAARVTVPESLATPLPIRHRNRLAFPHGTFSGTWNYVELQHAVKHGARIESISHAITWRKESPLLAPYASTCFKLRNEIAKSNPAMALWLKFLGNSLTGKLGQSPDMKIVALGDLADDPRYEIVGASPYVWARSTWKIAACAHVQWAATLTAHARVELHEQIAHAGDSWVYSDTDSVFSLHQLSRNLGKDCGEWDFDGIGRRWRAEAPKVYTYYDAQKEKDIAHAKGIPGAKDGDTVAPEVWNDYVAGNPVTSRRGVKSLLIAARGDRDPDTGKAVPGALFKRRELTRTFKRKTEWCGARLRDGHRTRAPNVTDLPRLK